MPKISEICSLFIQFFKLGCIAFGGPAAHLALFKKTFVDEKKWLSESEYAQSMAICQFMPGPASSQVGISIGIKKAGQLGGWIAWLAFTLPSALLLTLFAYGFLSFAQSDFQGAIGGLKLAAAAIVLHACTTMYLNFCRHYFYQALALCAFLAMLMLPSWWIQFAIIAVAGISSAYLSPVLQKPLSSEQIIQLPISKTTAIASFMILLSLLLLLPIVAELLKIAEIDLFSRFFRIGASVFGGGHVVLPMLQQEVVALGWVDKDAFLAGYGVTQAMPGPIFTFSAFLGTVNQLGVSPILACILCLFGIFAPSFLLINICFYGWQKIAQNPSLRRGLNGINAAVVGLLSAALYDPILTSSVNTLPQLAIFLLLVLIVFFRFLPIWLLVSLAGLLGYFWQWLQ